MNAQFKCGSANRRLLILDAAYDGTLLNGIDYLEVIDRDAPAGYPRQQTLIVRLFRTAPVGLGVDQLRLSGGVRYANIGISWVKRLADMTPQDGGVDYFDDHFPTPDDKAHVLVVRTDSYGDYSRYELALRRGLEDQRAPVDFDPALSTVEFWFKVECRASFDCRKDDDCPPELPQPPAIDYLAKDYATFRQVMLDRLSVVSPDWTDRNPADVGMVVVEALAYAADHLSYYQDAVATEAYLGTARRRLSVRRHARLLDYFMHEGANARAYVCLEVSPDVGSGGALLPRTNPDGSPTAFLTRCTKGARLPPDPPAIEDLLRDKQPRLFEPMHDALLFPAHNHIAFYTWGDDRCCLPKGATRATLRDSDDPGARLRLVAGDVLVLEEQYGRETGIKDDADRARRQAVRLTRVSPSAIRTEDEPGEPRVPGTIERDPLTGQAVVEVEWHPEDALRFPLCLWITKEEPRAPVSGACGNAVLVDHGRTRREPLSPAHVVDKRLYRPVLGTPGVASGVPFPAPTTPQVSATAALAQDPHQALPLVSIAGDEEWVARRDLLASDPFAAELVVEIDEDRVAHLRFGDATLGREPEDGLTAAYRIGGGVAGNVGAETIAHVVTFEPSITGVRNPLAATGGVEPEPIAEVKFYAPHAFRVQERAVTEADYAELAGRHSEVRRAVATRRWTGSWYTVFVTVDRAGGRPLDDSFRDELAGYLEQFRLAGEDLEVELPLFVPLDLRLVVCVKPTYFRGDVEQDIVRALSAGVLPGGGLGFFHPDRFTFGQSVYLSQVVGATMQVPGVDWVDPRDLRCLFQRFGELPAGEIDLGRIPMGRLEIARLDNSASQPENGRLELIMMGGQ